MALVIIAAALQAILFLLFRVFDKRNIALMPAIAVNYSVAAICGIVYAPPWSAGDLDALWLPSMGIGILFVLGFFLTGLTAQRSGVAASTVASKMSIILTVIFTVLFHHERPGPLGWLGLGFASLGVLLVYWSNVSTRPASAIWLPIILFVTTACIDISINMVQRSLLSASTVAVFPTLCLAFAGLLAWVIVARGGLAKHLQQPGVWIGGGLLGVANYGTLVFVVQALTYSGLQASIVFPLISIGVILLGTSASMLLFNERLNRAQTIGIALAVVALALLIAA